MLSLVKNSFVKKEPLQNLPSSLNSVISTNKRNGILTDHVIFKLRCKESYLIFINKLLWYHPKIRYENIVQKGMNKFLIFHWHRLYFSVYPLSEQKLILANCKQGYFPLFSYDNGVLCRIIANLATGSPTFSIAF